MIRKGQENKHLKAKNKVHSYLLLKKIDTIFEYQGALD